MNNPLVSVIIPAFNSEDYICEAIESVLSQTYKTIEIIVVDSSSDSTKKVLEPYHARITYLYQEPCGVSAARNLGLKHARGSLVAFQDADDRWRPEKLSIQVEALRKFPTAKVVFSDYLTFDQTGIVRSTGCWPHFHGWLNRHRVQDTDLAYGYLYWELMLGNCIGTCSALAIREVLNEYKGFDETFQTCEDLDLWLRIAARHPMLYVEEVLAEYRLHPHGLSGSVESRSLTWDLDRVKVREKHLRHNLVPADLRDKVEELQAKHCRELGWACLNEGKKRIARTICLTGLRRRPFDRAIWAYAALSIIPTSVFERMRRVKHALSEGQ